MKESSHGQVRRIIIDPGEYFVSKDRLIISTLLGSCVSACLWDPVNRVVGMNHFLLAHKRYRLKGDVLGSEAGRYGIHSMELLVNSMLSQGAKRNLIRAKAFGGGNVIGGGSHDNFFAVGSVNVRFIREFLDNEGIPLEKEHLGGTFGRIIHFHSEDFSVYMKRIEQRRQEKVLSEERHYWLSEISHHERDELTAKQAQFW